MLPEEHYMPPPINYDIPGMSLVNNLSTNGVTPPGQTHRRIDHCVNLFKHISQPMQFGMVDKHVALCNRQSGRESDVVQINRTISHLIVLRHT